MQKKVLILVPSYSLGGGAEKILSNILCNGNFSNYKIDIIEIEHSSLNYEKLPNNIKVINHLFSYKYPKILSIILMQLGKYFPNIVRKYLVKNDNYDIEISFAVMYPDIPFSKRDIRKIYWVHGSIEDFGLDRYKWRFNNYKKHFDNSDDIIAISKKTRQSIIDLYPEYENKIKLIYNGYDFNNIEKLANEKIDDVILENMAICSIGRIESAKGSDINLDIIRNLHLKGYNYHLYFIGTGKLESELKEKVKDYNLEDYVHFLGYKKNPYKYLKNMKVLLSSSKQEGFPGVYVEAMYLGVPFVSTEVGGTHELSQNGKYGKIVYNKEEAENSIINYMTNIEKVDIYDMKNFIQQFSLKKQVLEFEKLLEQERYRQ